MAANRALRRAVAPDVFEAFRGLVYRYGVADLAAAIGQRPGTLYNKADADDGSHNQPTLRDVLLVTRISDDMSVLDALNESFGRACYDCVQHEAASDEDLLQLVAELSVESGEFHRALAKGLQEKRFTTNVLRNIRGEAFDIVGALMVLVKRLEAYVDDDVNANPAPEGRTDG